MSIRYDMGRLDKIERTPQGGLRVDAVVTRTGVFTYRNADGSARRELRHPDHVFKADSLASLEDATLTYLHPKGVSPDNYKSVSIGHVRNPRQDGDQVATVAIIQDREAIDGVARGDIVEVSCGYSCDMLETPGEYKDEKYDAIQTNIVYNHVSVGPKNWGRGGNSVRLRLDSGAAIVDGIETASEDEREDNVDYITINGVQYEVGSKQHVQVLNGQLTAANARADAAESKLQEVTGRADSLQGKLDQSAKDLADARNPEAIAKAVKARVAIEAKASDIVGKSNAKFDGLSDREVMAQAISKKDSAFVLTEDHSAAYLQGRFDALVAQAPQSTTDKITAGINEARQASADKQDNGVAPPAPKNMSEQYYSQPFQAVKK